MPGILAVGDVHADARALPGGSFGDPEMCRKWNMSNFTNRLIPAIIKEADDRDVDAVIFTGDIFDTGKPLVGDAMAVRSGIMKIGRKVIIVTGNHDIKGLKDAGDNPLLSIFDGCHDITIVAGTPDSMEISGLECSFLPWPNRGDTVSHIINEADPGDIVFGHINMDGMAGERESVPSAELQSKWSSGVFGHVHTHSTGYFCYVGSSKHNSMLPGSTEPDEDQLLYIDSNLTMERIGIGRGFSCRVVPGDYDGDLTGMDGVVIEGDDNGLVSQLRDAGVLVTKRRLLPPVQHATQKQPKVSTGGIIDMVLGSLSDDVDISIARKELMSMTDN